MTRTDELRGDLVLSALMEATCDGDTESAIELSERLADVVPSARAWCTYVIAGCRALTGDHAGAAALLDAGLARGEWWSRSLLDDAALSRLWASADGPSLRAESLRRSDAAQRLARSEHHWVDFRPGQGAVVVALHGNGPLPVELQVSLWRSVAMCRALLVTRSSTRVAPDVPVWADRSTALREVAGAAEAAHRIADGAPIIIAGLGAGAELAAHLALSRPDLVTGAIAVAYSARRPPPVPGIVRQAAGARPSLLVLTGQGIDEPPAADLVRAAGTVGRAQARRVGGLGHALPRDVPAVMDGALRWVLESALPTPG